MTRHETPLQALDILGALARHEVDFVLIGGLAVQAHGHVRTTQDVDILPAADRGNLSHLAAALTELGARQLTDGDPCRLDADAIAAADTHVLDSPAGGIDVHLRPPGAAPYEDLRARALTIEVAGLSVAVAGKDDLIAMKRASGRPLDRGDVIALTALEAP